MPKNMISEKRKLAKIDAFISRALGRELNELSSLRRNYQKFWRILKIFFSVFSETLVLVPKVDLKSFYSTTDHLMTIWGKKITKNRKNQKN